MESANEAYELLFSSMRLGNLDGCLSAFSSAVCEEHFLLETAGSHTLQCSGSIHLNLVVKVSACKVPELVELFLNGLCHMWIHVPEICDAYARGKVQVHIAVNILDEGPFTPFCNYGEGFCAGYHVFLIILDNLPGLWPGWSHLY